MTGRSAYVAGTFDTKRNELTFLVNALKRLGVKTVTVDLATSGRPSPADIAPPEVARHHPGGAAAVFSGDRGAAVTAMAEAFARFIRTRRDVGGLISAGGSGGTGLATAGMRALPIGIPKVMVSTVASGDVGRYVGPSDIVMMYSVTDVQGINSISEQVLSNAAHALAGMIAHQRRDDQRAVTKPAIGLTMFGLTTPCVQAVTAALDADYDCLVFHATGTGGQSMEKLVDSHLLTGVIDATTTEIADYIVGGVFSAGADRLGAMSRVAIPYVGSCGALDMVNFHARDTVPTRFSGRRFHIHNPNVTLMRTTPEENEAMGMFIAERLNRMRGPVRFLIPEGGLSGIDAPGPALPRSGGRSRAVRRHRAADGAERRPAADQAALSHQRSGLRAGAGARLPRDRRPSAAEPEHEGSMARIDRSAILERLRAKAARGEPIVGGGAGTGLSAKCEEAGGIDLIVIYNSGRYRMAGRGSLAGLLAYGNANDIVVEMAREVLPVVKHTPVLAGVNGTDPFCLMDGFLDLLKGMGFSGVQNFPTVGLIDGTFRANLEETGMGYGLEVEMIRLARQKDLLTTPYVFSEESAAAMTEAGADIIVCHLGLTTGGAIGAGTALKLADCPALVDRWAAAARSVREDVLVLVHGGPVAQPEDAAFVLSESRLAQGFYGASSMERLPTEIALIEQTRKFVGIKHRGSAAE